MAERRVRMLVLSPFPEEAAGTRFRITHYIPYLQSQGFDVTVDSFFTPSFFRLVYRKDQFPQKVVAFAGLALRRLAAIPAARGYDLIFIYREAFPIGPPFVERYLSRGDAAIVLDFDDAIYLRNSSEANRFVESLKFVQKVATIVGLADRVIVGNQFLAAYARAHNSAVTTIPTCVDTARFVPRAVPAAPGPPVVGWIGSPTTTPYLASLGDVLRETGRRRPFLMRVSGSSEDFVLPGVNVRHEPWTLAREVELFNTCDIGVYPLTDDEWSRGKCGFKAIQFMACGVPVVASAVGVNKDIIEDGVNGFLASSPAEWVDKLDRLIADPALRARLGAAGRKTIEQRYSLTVQGPHMADLLRDAAQAGRRQRKRI
jgi:glycosyltransferase involved in cell wall biosynthesis